MKKDGTSDPADLPAFQTFVLLQYTRNGGKGGPLGSGHDRYLHWEGRDEAGR